MQLKLTALARELERGLKPAYLISGDESLLVEEACDDVLAAARANGFEERSVLHAEPGFHWHDVIQDAASMSLFASRRIIDLRVPGAKFDREASEVLRAYAAEPLPDTLLLIRCGRLEPRQRSSAWFKALDQCGIVVLVWPVSAAELPRWLEGRLGAAGLRLERDALTSFAERVEGNLLAAVQEIGKLKLAELPQPITVDSLLEVLEDAAHYDTFELLDAVYAADAARVSRMVRGVRAEGVAPFAILGALAAQLRRMGRGERLPPQRQKLLQTAVKRLGTARLETLLGECAMLDLQAKGMLRGDAWTSLESLLVEVAGGPEARLWEEAAHLSNR